MKLCLGTVQFGMDYGILGQKKPALSDAIACLDFATQNGIEAIDTAKAYGMAEEVVGEFLKMKTIPRDRLFLSTKFQPNLLDGVPPDEYGTVIERELLSQLAVLHTDYVDAYLFHSARYAFDEAKLEALHRMKEKGYVLKTGVSIYEPEEAAACFKSQYADFIQAPYSIFDHRMKKSGVIDSAEKWGCELHARSAFIQGLIIMEESQVPSYLERAKPIIRKIKNICDGCGISRVQLALQYVRRERGISHLVFGADSKEQVREDIEMFQNPVPAGILEEIENEFDDLEADIVMPSLWKR